MKEKYKQQLSTAAREILEHSGLSFDPRGDMMAVSPRDKAVKLVKAHPAEVQEIKAALMAEEAEERETAERRRAFRATIPGLAEIEAADEAFFAYRRRLPWRWIPATAFILSRRRKHRRAARTLPWRPRCSARKLLLRGQLPQGQRWQKSRRAHP